MGGNTIVDSDINVLYFLITIQPIEFQQLTGRKQKGGTQKLIECHLYIFSIKIYLTTNFPTLCDFV